MSASEEYCQRITRREARNFYWGFVALPHRQRVAIYALYSFSRQVDDDVDLTAPVSESLDRDPGSAQRKRIADCYSGHVSDPVMRVLAEVVQEYRIPEEELTALVSGVEMDLAKPRYADWAELDAYCRLVASAVGRMCTRIFGYTDPVALTHADDLGIALQTTNILRDVREDLELDRIYLPRDELNRFGVHESDLEASVPHHGWEELVDFQIERANRYFESGLKVTEYIPRRAAVCVRTMAGMYRSILKQIAEDPYLPLRQRASLRKRTKLKVMFRSWLRAA